MITRIRLIFALAGAVAAVSLVGAVWLHGNNHGRLKCEQATTLAVIAHQIGMRELADMVEAEQTRRAPVVRETIEVIKYVEDPTGCADTTIPADILDRLR